MIGQFQSLILGQYQFSAAVNLFHKKVLFSWPIITFLGFFNLCACTNVKVLKFRFKSKLKSQTFPVIYLNISRSL